MQVEQNNKLLDSLKSRNVDKSAGAMAIGNYAQGNGYADALHSAESFRYQKTEEELGIFAKNSVNRAVYDKPGMDQGKTVVEELSGKLEMTADMHRNEMAVLANTTTPEDFAKIQEEGFSISDTDSHTIVTVTDKIKTVMAKAGDEAAAANLSEEELEEITGSKAVVQQIERALKEHDLPVTKENVEDAQEALTQLLGINEFHDAGIAYMLKNHLEPTITNVYTAQYSSAGSAWSSGQVDITGMEEQIRQIIEESGLEVNDENMEDSKWLIDNEIPLDREHLIALQQYKELSASFEAEGKGLAFSEVFDAMAAAISEGKRPADGMLIAGYSFVDRADSAVETVMNATDEDLADLIQRGEMLTIANLDAAIHRRENGTGRGAEIMSVQDGSDSYTRQGAALLTARRQLEEVRLAMTTEANLALLKKGISIDTKPLEQLVEDLKAQEDAYYKQLLNSERIETSEENVRMFADTTQMVEELRYQPAYALDLYSGEETIPQLHGKGSVLQETLTRANNSYETMMTVPRWDLGDSIQKAFGNVDDILKDLEMDTSEANRRAVRILAYNEIELTVDNINKMKAADEEVQRTFRSLTPAVTLEMIRREQNPLDMSFEELNRVTEQIRAELGHEDSERFSKFLYKLEQNHQISEEERASYIGIYRLIAQVEKTDGAAIGSLLNRGESITMRNLLSEVRTSHKKGMDYKVDDDFEGVEAKYTGTRIDDQIQTAYQQNCLKDVAEQIAPEKIAGHTPEELLDMTLEQLKELLEQVPEDAETEQAYAREQLSRFSEMLSASDDVYTFLDRYDLPNTMINVMAASRMMKNPGQMFKDLWKGANEDTVEGLKEELLSRFGEAVKHPEEMADAQEALAETAERVMEGMIIEDHSVTSLDIRQMRIMCRQFNIAARQAKEECFVIPMQTGDEVTGVSLKIIRGKKEKGMVDILFESEQLGKVAATFELRESGISGTIITENQDSWRFLQKNREVFTEQLSENGEEINIRMIHSGGSSLEEFEANVFHRENRLFQDSEEQTQRSPVQTRRLYQIAERFLNSVKQVTG